MTRSGVLNVATARLCAKDAVRAFTTLTRRGRRRPPKSWPNLLPDTNDVHQPCERRRPRRVLRASMFIILGDTAIRIYLP